MLSTVYAAEAQFRHDTEQRAREFALLESIRNREDALAASATLRLRSPRAAAWPRPIDVKLHVAMNTAVCA